MTGLSSQPFIPAGSKYSHHASTKAAKRAPGASSLDDDRRRLERVAMSSGHADHASSPSRRLDSAKLSDPLGSPRCSLVENSSLTQAQDRLQLITCEADNMGAKLKSVQEVLETAKEDLAELRGLIARLERLTGSKNIEKAELKCSLLRTHIEGLNQSVKTMPHYYPSRTMFLEAIMALKDALSCHDYVNVVDGEKSRLLREHERLRDEMRLLTEENEKLKRKHHKDKKIILELSGRRSASQHQFDNCEGLHGNTKGQTTFSPRTLVGTSQTPGASAGAQCHSQTQALSHQFNSPNNNNNNVSNYNGVSDGNSHSNQKSHRDEDLKLVKMLQQVKGLLQSEEERGDVTQKRGLENNNADCPSNDHEQMMRRLREVIRTDRGETQPPQNDEFQAMDSYFRIFEKNISIIEKELHSGSTGCDKRDDNSNNTKASATTRHEGKADGCSDR